MYMLAGKTIIQTDGLTEPLLLGYSLDITDRAIAEAELRNKEMFIRQVLDTGPNLIFVKDLEGNFLLVNKATADLFNTTKEELILQNNYKVHRIREENEHYSKTDRQVIEEGITVDTEEPFTKPNGPSRSR
jgi:PAS domain S-box-containing protein